MVYVARLKLNTDNEKMREKIAGQKKGKNIRETDGTRQD